MVTKPKNKSANKKPRKFYTAQEVEILENCCYAFTSYINHSLNLRQKNSKNEQNKHKSEKFLKGLYPFISSYLKMNDYNRDIKSVKGYIERNGILKIIKPHSRNILGIYENFQKNENANKNEDFKNSENFNENLKNNKIDDFFEPQSKINLNKDQRNKNDNIFLKGLNFDGINYLTGYKNNNNNNFNLLLEKKNMSLNLDT